MNKYGTVPGILSIRLFNKWMLNNIKSFFQFHYRHSFAESKVNYKVLELICPSLYN